MRVVIVRSCLETASSRMAKQAQLLTAQGYEVTVLVWDRERRYPRVEKKGNYKIHRFNFKAPFGPKILPFLPVWWCFEFRWLLRGNWDIVDAIDFDSIVPAVIIAKIKRKLVIYQMADTYEDEIVLPQVLRRLCMSVDKLFMRLANGVIIVDEARIKEFCGIPNRNIVVIYNSPPDHHKQLDGLTQGGEEFTLFYAAVLHKRRQSNLDKVFQAIKSIDKVRLVIAGYGDQVDEVKRWSDEFPDKVSFIGKISYTEVLERTMAANLLIALYAPAILNTVYTTADKLFEAMMCHKPILVSKGTRTTDIVEKEECGLVVDCNSVDEIRKAILRLKENPDLCRQLGANGRRAYENRYSWEMMGRRLVDLYRKLIK